MCCLTRPPHLVDIRWEPKNSTGDLKQVALVGKGVTFDTGGLNLKGGSSMIRMKQVMNA